MEKTTSKKLLFLSRPGVSTQFILSELQKHDEWQIEYRESSAGALQLIATGQIDCLILNLDHFQQSQADLIKGIRELRSKFKVVVLADNVDKSALRSIGHLSDIVVFEKANMDLIADFPGLSKRMLQNEVIAKRRARRYSAAQTVKIEGQISHQVIGGRSCNISKTGMHVEYDSPHLGLGEDIKLFMSLDRVSKQYNLKGKVVWVRPVPGKNCFAAGIHFVKENENKEVPAA